MGRITSLIFLAIFMFSANLQTSDKAEAAVPLKGKIRIDGSSTVFPVTEAVAEEFNKVHPRVRITVGVSGTGGGFKKFATGEIDINDASRPIKDKEIKKAKANNVEYIELPVAYDGLSVIVNPKNNWVKKLTVAQLKKLWQPGSKVMKWKDLDPSWPDRKIKLYGPGPDSGTFDYFTEAINGKSGASRSDYTKSEDDNILVQGIAGDVDAIGYFGYAYYNENKTKIKAVPIDNGKGAVAPTEKTINDGTYAPLSRPIFIYVGKKAGQRKETQEFIKYYLTEGPKLAKEVGYIPMPDKYYADGLKKFNTFIK